MKTNLLTAAAVAIFAITPAFANDVHCKVVDANGHGLIKENRADSGPNKAGDADAWILVSSDAVCAEINAGKFDNAPDAKDKIEGAN